MEAYVAHALLQPRSYNITVPIDLLVMISEKYIQRFLHLENRIRNSRASDLRIPLGSSGAEQIELPIYYKRGETHGMNKSPNDRGSREAEVLCLCPICAAYFYLSGKYTIRKADEM